MNGASDVKLLCAQDDLFEQHQISIAYELSRQIKKKREKRNQDGECSLLAPKMRWNLEQAKSNFIKKKKE